MYLAGLDDDLLRTLAENVNHFSVLSSSVGAKARLLCSVGLS
jgi:hypothetical protein